MTVCERGCVGKPSVGLYLWVRKTGDLGKPSPCCWVRNVVIRRGYSPLGVPLRPGGPLFDGTMPGRSDYSSSVGGTMARRKLCQYAVEGVGKFPLDMLRHDCAWPANQGAIENLTKTGRRKVQLRSLLDPTRRRWASLGWEVRATHRDAIGTLSCPWR